MEFEWDPAKALRNKRKHAVSFEEGASKFGDPLAITFADPDHSAGEMRWLSFGLSDTGKLLVVSHTQRARRVRIISAREATSHDRKIYQEG